MSRPDIKEVTTELDVEEELEKCLRDLYLGSNTLDTLEKLRTRFAPIREKLGSDYPETVERLTRKIKEGKVDNG